MKKNIILTILAASLMFGSENINSCPDLSIKNKDIENAKGLRIGLKKSLPVVSKTYEDIVSKYNDTKNIEAYVSKANFENLGITKIWGKLLQVNYKISDTKNESVKNDIKEVYTEILNEINSKNKNWCN